MKKLLFIACFLPFAAFAQTIVKIIQLPDIDVNGITNLRTYEASSLVEGIDQEKLAAILHKWIASNFTASNDTAQAAGNDATRMNGQGNAAGTYIVQQLTPFQHAPDKLILNAPAVDYKIKFAVTVIVTDGKYNIALNNFKIEVFNTTTPLEQFYKHYLPVVIIPDEYSDMDISDMYRRIFEDVDSHSRNVVASALKYVVKEKKKAKL